MISSADEPAYRCRAYIWVVMTAAALKSRIVVWQELTSPKLRVARSIAGADCVRRKFESVWRRSVAVPVAELSRSVRSRSSHIDFYVRFGSLAAYLLSLQAEVCLLLVQWRPFDGRVRLSAKCQ
jgi:hypothetical protein